MSNLEKYISYHIYDKQLIVMDLGIPKNIRRKGYGTKIVKNIINKHSKEIDSVCVGSNASRMAVSFWMHLGFQFLDKEEKYKANIVLKSMSNSTIFDFEGSSIIYMVKKL